MCNKTFVIANKQLKNDPNKFKCSYEKKCNVTSAR